MGGAPGDRRGGLGTVCGRMGPLDVAITGVETDQNGRPVDRDLLAAFDERHTVQVLPLAGLSLPFPDKHFDECRVLGTVLHFSAKYRDAVVAEAERVAKRATFAGTRVDDTTAMPGRSA